MKDDRSIRLVCFDLGGVVIRICRTWREGCETAGLDWRGPAHEDTPDIRGRAELARQIQIGAIDRDTYAARLSAAMNGLYSPSEIIRIHEAWLLGEYDGVGEVLTRIHAAGLDTASLSNTDHAHWVQMDKYPAFMRLRHRWASHLLGLQKPDPTIFHEFERRVGFAGSGSRILYFDDLHENVEAARAVGWQAELIDPAGRTDVQMISALTKHRVLSGS